MLRNATDEELLTSPRNGTPACADRIKRPARAVHREDRSPADAAEDTHPTATETAPRRRSTTRPAVTTCPRPNWSRVRSSSTPLGQAIPPVKPLPPHTQHHLPHDDAHRPVAVQQAARLARHHRRAIQMDHQCLGHQRQLELMGVGTDCNPYRGSDALQITIGFYDQFPPRIRWSEPFPCSLRPAEGRNLRQTDQNRHATAIGR